MKYLPVAFTLLSLAGFGISNSVSASQEQPINVVTSFSVLADVVKNVGGDYIKVSSLVPTEGDPHEYEPTPKDAKSLKSADVTFVSGEGFETWFDRLVKASGTSKPAVVVSEGIKTHTFEDEGEIITDPHVWNSIPNVIIWVGNIEKALEKADPADAAAYQANAKKYISKLNALNASIHKQIDAVPENKRQVLTSHDAFGYYGEEYGVRFLSPLGVSTETEATAADIADLIDQIKKEHIRVYFFENSNDTRLVKQVAAATGAKLGGELYPESLSDASGPVPTYYDMMEYNTKLIVEAISQ